ncbi:MAG: hypothetical protein QNJ90_11490, partial [Planctomycetota bacterium]|nr:hypothetical protein [Planctomycetota bacterium]
MEHLLLPIVIPGAAALLVFLLPASLKNLRTVVAVLGSLGLLAAGIGLISERGIVSWPWMDLGGLQLDFALRMDAFASWTVALVG